MLDHFRRRVAVMLQHFLHQVNTAARTIEFVAQQHISRAGRRAEAAMHAFADHGLRRGHGGIGQPFGGEAGLHGSEASGFKKGKRVEGTAKARLQRGDAPVLRMKGRHDRPHRFGRAQ